MAFNVKDLSTSIDAFQDAKDGAWVVVIGCATSAVPCPDKTQPDANRLREGAIDFRAGVRTADDRALLQQQLLKLLNEIRTEAEAAAPAPGGGGGEPPQ